MSGELYWRTAERAPNGGSIEVAKGIKKCLTIVYIFLY